MKEFWLGQQDALWFLSEGAHINLKPQYLVTSEMCQTTLQMGDSISDVGHKAVAFEAHALEFVNLDAVRTGGIKTLQKFE